MNNLNDEQALKLSKAIEDLLVARNLRGMQTIQPALEPGYYARAAHLISQCQGTILIGTGFPVTDTFETDGPVGAIALYNTLIARGNKPVLVCGPPLSDKLANDYCVQALPIGLNSQTLSDTQQILNKWQPELIISIERPGKAADGHYYNMRGEDISARAACFDDFLNIADCPTIGVGDGGNEIGMGNIAEALQALDIVPSTTTCDELIIADVSNWGALGLIAMLSWHETKDCLKNIDPLAILQYLSTLGSVDGVTRENQLTEDGLPASEGIELIGQLQQLVANH
jgi:hypothetical protein